MMSNSPYSLLFTVANISSNTGLWPRRCSRHHPSRSECSLCAQWWAARHWSVFTTQVRPPWKFKRIHENISVWWPFHTCGAKSSCKLCLIDYTAWGRPRHRFPVDMSSTILDILSFQGEVLWPLLPNLTACLHAFRCRFVFMFKPGSYNVEVPVGYYTQILGLGTHPSEVIFTSSKGVYSQERFGCSRKCISKHMPGGQKPESVLFLGLGLVMCDKWPLPFQNALNPPVTFFFVILTFGEQLVNIRTSITLSRLHHRDQSSLTQMAWIQGTLNAVPGPQGRILQWTRARWTHSGVPRKTSRQMRPMPGAMLNPDGSDRTHMNTLYITEYPRILCHILGSFCQTLEPPGIQAEEYQRE